MSLSFAFRAPRVRRVPRAAALALTLTCLAGGLQAQTLTYTARGSVTTVVSPTGIWSGVQVSDPFTVVYTVDSTVAGSPLSQGVLYADAVLGVDLLFGDVASSAVVDGDAPPALNRCIVTNDVSGSGLCRDEVNLVATAQADYHRVSLNLQRFSTCGCPTLISSTALPLALTPRATDSRDVLLETSAGGGILIGTIDSVLISSSLVRPQNDLLGAAAEIAPGLTAFDTSLATTDGDALDALVCDMGPFGDEQIHRDVWYRFTPPVSGEWEITTVGLVGFDTRLAVYDPSLAAGPTTTHVTYRGSVAVVTVPFVGPWTGIQVGDPFELVLTVANPIDGPGYRQYDVVSSAVLVGPASSDAPSSGLSGFFLYDDRPITSTECSDAVIASLTESYSLLADMQESTSGCCPDILDSLDPTTVNPDDFDPMSTVARFGGGAFGDLGRADLTLDEIVFAQGPFGPRGDPLAVIACNDDAVVAPPFEAGLIVPLDAGTEYFVRLGSFDVPTGGGPGHLLVRRVPDPSFCSAEDGALAACPCANPGAFDTGCDIAQATGGVKLEVVAQETAPSNRATMVGSGYPASTFPAAVVIRGTSLEPMPVAFGDGLRCVGVPLVRLAATAVTVGISSHTFAHGAMAGSGSFYYQLWFRNTPAMYCTPDAFNLSNGRVLDW